MSYRIVDISGEWTDRQTGARAIMAELSADTASDLPSNTTDLQYVLGSWSRTVDTGDIYRINSSGVWVLQPSTNAFSNVYTKAEIDSMITEIYGIIAYYHTTIVSDTGEITFYALAGYIGTWKIYGNGQQTGTPTPDAPIMPTFCGMLDGTDWKIPLTCAGQTVPVYLGQVSTVRRVKKLVLDGTENWRFASSDSNRTVCKLGLSGRYVVGYCTHINWKDSYEAQEYNRIVYDEYLYVSLENGFLNAGTVDAFTSYLAQQHANGTPVIIWYVLAEAETSIVNEPLAKIGDYADELHSEDAGVTIPTIKGSNTLTVDTTLKPSKIIISGESN